VRKPSRFAVGLIFSAFALSAVGVAPRYAGVGEPNVHALGRNAGELLDTIGVFPLLPLMRPRLREQIICFAGQVDTIFRYADPAVIVCRTNFDEADFKEPSMNGWTPRRRPSHA